MYIFFKTFLFPNIGCLPAACSAQCPKALRKALPRRKHCETPPRERRTSTRHPRKERLRKLARSLRYEWMHREQMPASPSVIVAEIGRWHTGSGVGNVLETLEPSFVISRATRKGIPMMFLCLETLAIFDALLEDVLSCRVIWPRLHMTNSSSFLTNLLPPCGRLKRPFLV